MTSDCFENTPARIFPWKNAKYAITIPAARDAPIPNSIDFLALSFFPAPIFCATNADNDCENDDGTSMIKAQTFSATPTPAEAITPRLFTMELITRNDIFTSPSCKAIGSPTLIIFPTIFYPTLYFSLKTEMAVLFSLQL